MKGEGLSVVQYIIVTFRGPVILKTKNSYIESE